LEAFIRETSRPHAGQAGIVMLENDGPRWVLLDREASGRAAGSSGQATRRTTAKIKNASPERLLKGISDHLRNAPEMRLWQCVLNPFEIRL